MRDEIKKIVKFKGNHTGMFQLVLAKLLLPCKPLERSLSDGPFWLFLELAQELLFCYVISYERREN